MCCIRLQSFWLKPPCNASSCVPGINLACPSGLDIKSKMQRHKGLAQHNAMLLLFRALSTQEKATLVSQDCGQTFLVMWWDLSDNQRFCPMKWCVLSHASWKMITFKPYFWCSKPLCQWHQTNKIWFTTTIALVDAVGYPRQFVLDLPFPWHSSRKRMKTYLFLYSLPTLQTAPVEDAFLNFSTEFSIFIPSSPIQWPHWPQAATSRLKKWRNRLIRRFNKGNITKSEHAVCWKHVIGKINTDIIQIIWQPHVAS